MVALVSVPDPTYLRSQKRPRPGCGRGLATAWALLAVERGPQFATEHVLNIEINAVARDPVHGSENGRGDRQRDARRRAGDIRIVCIETAAGIRAPEMDAPPTAGRSAGSKLPRGYRH